MLVIMADQLSTPAGSLFMGALVPGLILGALYMAYILLVSYLSPKSAPLPEDLEPLTLTIIVGVLKSVIPPTFLIFCVLGSIFFGVATPTEAAGIGAFGATILAIINRRFSLSTLTEVCVETTKTTAFVFAVLIGATAFSLVLRGLGGDALIEQALNSLPFGPVGVVICCLLYTSDAADE